MKDAVRINLEGLSYGKDIRRKIEHEFSEILRLLNFNVKVTIFLEDGMLMVEYFFKS